MVKVLVKDPAGGKRNGWRDVYGNAEDALAGNVSRVFLTGVPQSVPTTDAYQPDGWSCGPYSLAECLGQGSGENARNWLLERGLITSAYGTEYSGIVGYLGACGYSCSYDGRAHDAEMTGSIFEQIISHLQKGYKAILCMHGRSKGCRTDWWTVGGHYVTLYGISESGPTDDSYTFKVRQLKAGMSGKDVTLLQKLLCSRGMYAAKSIDGNFGPKTEASVKKYQKWISEHGGRLTQDGIAGPATWTSILGFGGTMNSDASVTFTVYQVKSGDNNLYVFLAQQILTADGLYKSSLDKNFGPASEKAVKAAQKTHNIKQDGICGPTTFKMIIGF